MNSNYEGMAQNIPNNNNNNNNNNNRRRFTVTRNPMMPYIAQELRREAQENLLELERNLRQLGARGLFLVPRGTAPSLYRATPLSGEALESYVNDVVNAYSMRIIHGSGWEETKYEQLRKVVNSLKSSLQQEQARESGAGAGAEETKEEEEETKEEEEEQEETKEEEEQEETKEEEDTLEEDIADRVAWLGLGGEL